MPTRREIKFMYVLIQNEIFFVTAQLFVKKGMFIFLKIYPPATPLLENKLFFRRC